MSHLLIYILVIVVLQYATNDVQNLMVLIGSGSTGIQGVITYILPVATRVKNLDQ